MTAPPDPSLATRGRARAASTVVGAALALAAAVFVGRALVRDRAEIADALDGARPGWLALAVVLAVVGMTAIAVPWRRAIRLLGADLPLGQTVRRYFVGEIGKYVPGGVWPILGRGELARRWGIPRAAAYGSVLLSLAALYLASMFVVVAGLPTLVAGGDGSGPIAVLLLLPVGLVALHPRVLGFGVSLVERVTRRTIELPLPSWRASVGLVSRYLPAWLAIGGATWAVARSLDPSAGLLEVGVAAALSWIVGFVLVPVPGGVGVREAAFVAARVIFVLVDAVGALLSLSAVRANQPDGARS